MFVVETKRLRALLFIHSKLKLNEINFSFSKRVEKKKRWRFRQLIEQLFGFFFEFHVTICWSIQCSNFVRCFPRLCSYQKRRASHLITYVEFNFEFRRTKLIFEVHVMHYEFVLCLNFVYCLSQSRLHQKK